MNNIYQFRVFDCWADVATPVVPYVPDMLSKLAPGSVVTIHELGDAAISYRIKPAPKPPTFWYTSEGSNRNWIPCREGAPTSTTITNALNSLPLHAKVSVFGYTYTKSVEQPTS